MSDAGSFARELLGDLCRLDPVASALRETARGKTATIGIDDHGEWVPLLRLSNPSASYNVMSLDVRHKRGWAPTFERGTPAILVQKLAGPLRFTWAAEVEAACREETSGRVH
jgi:hypothetical protein